MKTGVTTSVIAHAALLIVAIVGLGSARPVEPEAVESIAVDLVPISDVTNIRAGSLDSKVVQTDTPAIVEASKPAELAQPTGNTAEDQPTPEATSKTTPAPVENTAPKPAPDPAPEKAPDPVKDPTPPTPAPVAAPDPAPTPVQPQQQQEVTTATDDTPADNVAPTPATRPVQLQKALVKDPPKDTKVATVIPKKTTTAAQPDQSKTPPDPQAKTADKVAELLNAMDSRGATTGDGGSPTLGKTTGKSATLTQSQLDGLVAQIKNCMNVPAGAADAGVTAELHFILDASGNVTQMPDILSDTSTPLARALASAAQRAVMRCGPYAMAVNQEVQATFDPRDLT
ncbi:MAG TPA: hypothetical protein VHZ56_05450 [Devosia sp.]|nr:hypothetical protein [Devosia sp.]